MTATPTETRFALVLNGGVSLAIWMGGVVHELNRVRIASSGVPPDDPAELVVHEAWRRILEDTGRTVVIDAVAGTSAGGLNGTLLATSVARGADLPTMKGVWADIASLERGRLLRADAEGAPSVLDGRFFADQVGSVVGSIVPRPDLAPQECTLLVTATALGPQARRYALEGELDAWAVDSRRVYRFRQQHDASGAPERADFADDTVVEAARASAGFPVAFAPVWESDRLRHRRRDQRADDPPTWLIDGGVLDNAPFEPLIDELRDRSVAAPFERVVLYVTPSTAAAAEAWTDGSAPDVARVMGAVVGAVREPDQREDMATLGESFARAAYSRSSPHHLLADLLLPGVTPLLDREQARTVASTLFGVYRARRLEEVERWLTTLNRVPQLVPAPPLELGASRPPVVPDNHRFDAASWTWGLPAAARVLRWWGRALVRACDGDGRAAQLMPAFAELDRAQRRVRTLRREEEARLRTAVGSADTPQARLEALEQVHDDLGTITEVGGLLAAVTDAIAAALGGGLSGPGLAQYVLDVEVVSSAMAQDTGDRPSFRYRQVTPAAPPLMPVGITGRGDWPARKLYGERWSHFGAFGSRDGRAHDWLWGRLDGASALCEHLLGPGFRDHPLATALAEAILEADGTSPDLLEARAEDAYAKTPGQLFREMAEDDPVRKADSIWLLTDTVPEVLGEVRTVGNLLEAAFARDLDREDLPRDASIGTLARVAAVRSATYAIRAYALERLRKSLE